MAKPIQQPSGRALSDFQRQWWKRFGLPDTSPDDRHWVKVGTDLLYLSPCTAAGMLLTLIFGKNRDRARLGLNELRSLYKKTYPKVAALWGRGRSGRPSSLTPKQCVAITLAVKFGVKKVRILKEAGMVDESFDSGLDSSSYALIDRASKEGRRSPLFVTERNRLQALPPGKRERQILAMLKRTGKHSRSNRQQRD